MNRNYIKNKENYKNVYNFKIKTNHKNKNYFKILIRTAIISQ